VAEKRKDKPTGSPKTKARSAKTAVPGKKKVSADDLDLSVSDVQVRGVIGHDRPVRHIHRN
jgi:hypothetical protein